MGAASATRSSVPGCDRRPACFDANEKLTQQDLVTIEPDDILQSSVFSDTEEEPATVASS